MNITPELKTELLEKIHSKGGHYATLVEEDLRLHKPDDPVNYNTWITYRNSIRFVLGEFEPQWNSTTSSAYQYPTKLIEFLQDQDLSEETRDWLNQLTETLENNLTVKEPIFGSQYESELSAARSVIYAWKWSKRSNVKFGKTEVGMERWRGGLYRQTDDDPEAHQEYLSTLGDQQHIGFVQVSPEHLNLAENFLRRLFESRRQGNSEFFSITKSEALAGLEAVAAKYGQIVVEA